MLLEDWKFSRVDLRSSLWDALAKEPTPKPCTEELIRRIKPRREQRCRLLMVKDVIL
jgi:hypothetical protein